jgi:hypothetical protein
MLLAAADQQSGQQETGSLQPMAENQADAAAAAGQQLSTDPTENSSTTQEGDAVKQLQDLQETPYASTEEPGLQEDLHASAEAITSAAEQTAAAEGAAEGPAQQQQQGAPSGASLAGDLSLWRPFANLTTVLDVISAHWIRKAADQGCPVVDVQYTTECPQQDNMWQAQQQAAAAPGSCTAQDAAAGPAEHPHAPMQQQHEEQQQRQEEEGLMLSTPGSAGDFPPGALLTPQLIMDAYLRIGVCCGLLQGIISSPALVSPAAGSVSVAAISITVVRCT